MGRTWRSTSSAVAVALAAALFTAGLAGAQESSRRVNGVVRDESGAIVPGATVKVESVGTGLRREAFSDETGFYLVPLLPPGEYRVRVTLSGFRTFVREGITVSVDQASRVDATLTVGGTEEHVVVTDAAPLVETSSAAVGLVIDEAKVVDLPLNGRNFTQLGSLMPGAVASPEIQRSAYNSSPGFSVAGQRTQSNNFLLDGASNNESMYGGYVLNPPPDAVREFKIQTHSYPAQYGRSSGSVVNIVTKSGTNVMHGTGFEFFRDDALEATNYFARSKPQLNQHQYGGVLGFPLVRNRLSHGTMRDGRLLVLASGLPNFHHVLGL